MAGHNIVGKLGEDIASEWLLRNGYGVLERNYLKKYGEIDIVAHETKNVHFIEVKSVSYETKAELRNMISRETYRPEDNVHRLKQKRLGRVIQSWISEHSYTGKWQIDILSVYIVPREKYAEVRLLTDVIFE